MLDRADKDKLTNLVKIADRLSDVQIMLVIVYAQGLIDSRQIHSINSEKHQE
jgi:hypothetical protein